MGFDSLCWGFAQRLHIQFEETGDERTFYWLRKVHWKIAEYGVYRTIALLASQCWARASNSTTTAVPRESLRQGQEDNRYTRVCLSTIIVIQLTYVINHSKYLLLQFFIHSLVMARSSRSHPHKSHRRLPACSIRSPKVPWVQLEVETRIWQCYGICD